MSVPAGAQFAPICLQLLIDQTNPPAPVIPNPTGAGKCWTTTFILQATQRYNGGASTYNTYSIVAGHWIAATVAGYAWRVRSVVSVPNSTNITLVIEDVDNYNSYISNLNVGGGPSTSSPNCILFSLNSWGQPVVSPLFGRFQSTTTLNLPVEILSRFNALDPERQYIDAYQSGHSFVIGDPICAQGGTFSKANNSNVKYVFGVVSGINNPAAGWFTFKSLGSYYSDVNAFFPGIDFTQGGTVTPTLGTFYYYDTSGVRQYTTTPPSDTAMPAWVYLGVDAITGKIEGILYGAGGGGGGGVAGSNTQVIFNQSGAAAGSSALTFDYTNGILNVSSLKVLNATYMNGNLDMSTHAISGVETLSFTQSSGSISISPSHNILISSICNIVLNPGGQAYTDQIVPSLRYSNSLITSFSAASINVVGGSWINNGVSAYGHGSNAIFKGAGYLTNEGGGTGWRASARFSMTSNLPEEYFISSSFHLTFPSEEGYEPGTFTFSMFNINEDLSYSIIMNAPTMSDSIPVTAVTIANFSGNIVYTGSHAIPAYDNIPLTINYSNSNVRVSISETSIWSATIPGIGTTIQVADYNGQDNFAGSAFYNFVVAWTSQNTSSGQIRLGGDIVPISPYIYSVGSVGFPLNNVYTGTINAWDLKAQDTPYFVSYTPGSGTLGYTVAGSKNQFIYNTGAGVAGSTNLTTMSGYTVIGLSTPSTTESIVVYSNKFNVSAWPDGLNYPTVNTISGVFTDNGIPYEIDLSKGLVLPAGAEAYYSFLFTNSSTLADTVQCTFTVGNGQTDIKTTGLVFYDILGREAYSFYYKTIEYGYPYLHIVNEKTSETLYSEIRNTNGPTVISVTRTNQYISFTESGQHLLTEAVFDLAPTCRIIGADFGTYDTPSYITDFVVKKLSGFPVTNTLAVGGDITPMVNGAYNIGAPGYEFKTIYASSLNIESFIYNADNIGGAILGSVNTSSQISTFVPNPTPGNSVITTDTGNLWVYKSILLLNRSILVGTTLTVVGYDPPAYSGYQYLRTNVIPPGTDSCTYECWFYQLVATSGNNTIFSTRLNGYDVSGIQVTINPFPAGITVITSDVSANYACYTPLYTWHHIALVRNGSSQWTFFLNGVTISSDWGPTFTYQKTTNTDVYVGGFFDADYSQQFIGYVTNFRYVKGTAVYTSNFTVPTTRLTSISGTELLLLTLSDAILYDSSPNHYTVTNEGSATSIAASPFSLYRYDFVVVGNIGYISGSTSQILYNNSGVAVGSTALTFNNMTGTTTVSSLVVKNALTISDTFLFSGKSVHIGGSTTGYGGITASGNGGYDLWWGSSGTGGANDRLWRFAWQNDRNVVIYTGETANWSTGTSTSDGRLKTNIVKTSLSCADIVMTTNVVDFKWKLDSDLNDGGKTHTGFIAQDLEGKVPDAVKNIGGTKLLHKEELVPILWKALQDTINRVSILEQTISALLLR